MAVRQIVWLIHSTTEETIITLADWLAAISNVYTSSVDAD